MGAGLTVQIPEPEDIPLSVRTKCLPSLDLDGVVQLLKQGKVKKVVCLCGAGISVSAGIPDFRSPGTGLYSQLEKYDLPTPESIFSLDYFREKPKAFCTLAKEMFPGRHRPTAAHAFLRLLQDKGLLFRCYTQNIDTLERLAGLEAGQIVEAHGSFADAHCVELACRAQFKLQDYRDLNRCRCGKLQNTALWLRAADSSP